MTNGQGREYEGKIVPFLLPQQKKTQKSLICPQPAVSALLGKPLPDKQAFLRFIWALCLWHRRIYLFDPTALLCPFVCSSTSETAAYLTGAHTRSQHTLCDRGSIKGQTNAGTFWWLCECVCVHPRWMPSHALHTHPTNGLKCTQKLH